MSQTTQSARLTQQQVAEFKENGYTFYRQQIFSPEEFNRLVDLFDDITEKKENPDMVHKRRPELFEFLAHPKVLDIVSQIIGDSIALWASHFISKPPHSGGKTPWHTDSDYWASQMNNIYDVKICTIWLALDDVDYENGCMGVIPGSHKLSPSDHLYSEAGPDALFTTELSGVDESQAVWFELKKGTFSLHDPKIIHGAHPNKSDRRRCGYTMRYLSGNVDMKQKDHPMYRLRGTVEGNGNFLEIPKL